MKTITTETIKAAIELRLPENWDYAHDFYVDEAIDSMDIEAMLAGGYTVEELADEAIAEAIALEGYAFEAAMKDPLNADGINGDDDAVWVDDEVYTAAHARELKEAYEEALACDAEYRRDMEYMWYHRD